ncbi:MAG: hypothetical protein GX627_01875 [Parcubacteria group bacterium]|jgi:uncharacterized protein YpmB|nr:hypothetical protein [Parcubacteria group bacterium]
MNNNRTTFLGLILVVLLIVAYKVMFMDANKVDTTNEENIAASARAEALLKQVENIDFDTSVVQDPKFQSLKSIEVPLMSLPVGKENPFSPKTSGSN